MLFSNLCSMLDEIKSGKDATKKLATFKKLLTQIRELNAANSKTAFYPLLRLVFPKLERERGPYGLKETALAKCISNVLCLNPNGTDYKLLRNYKVSKLSKIADFPDAAFSVLRKKFTASTGLTVEAVNVFLDELAQKNTDNDPRGQESVFSRFLQVSSAEEQKWFIRIVLKEMKLGVGRDRLLTVYHKDAVQSFNRSSNLQKMCELLYDPTVNLNEIDVEMFEPSRPMLSARCDSQQLQKKIVLDGKQFFVEEKFDGERFIIHMKDGAFKYYSRQGYDFTKTFGETYENGIYTPLLKNAAWHNVDSFILDGELVGYNKKNGTFGSKGMSYDIKKGNKYYTPFFFAFDILYLNDEVLTNKTLTERKAILKAAIKPVDEALMVSEHKEVSTIIEVIQALNLSVDKKQEGIMIKDPGSFYLPNERNGWWKMKLEYFEGVMSDLDVIIIGGYYGARKKITGFLVGIKNVTDAVVTYLSFVKVATGLNKDEVLELQNELDGHWNPINGNQHEDSGVRWGKEVPDVWIEPENSHCLTVRGTELTKVYGNNPSYMAPYTLRFPRIQKLRLDKRPEDCLTILELCDLTTNSSQIEKLNKRHLELSDLSLPSVANKRARKGAHNQIPDVEVPLSALLEGYEFLVLTGNDTLTKQQVEKSIRENGGSVVGSETTQTQCMLMGHPHERLNTYKGDIDIVNLDWLLKLLEASQFRIYTPQEILYTSPTTHSYFMVTYDVVGDPFVTPATPASVEAIVATASKNKRFPNPMLSEIRKFTKDFTFLDDDERFRYDERTAYFDRSEIINDRTSKEINGHLFKESILFKRGYGKPVDFLDAKTQFIVTNTENVARVVEFKSYLKQLRNFKCRIYGNSGEIPVNSVDDESDSADDGIYF